MTADHPDRRFPPLVVLLVFSKIALVIIENGARWLVENFVISRYNHR